MLSNELEYCLNDAFHRARGARHEYLTVEHLLLAILNTPKIREILAGCGAEPAKLQQELQEHVDRTTARLEQSDGREVAPTIGFQRVLQRAVFHVRSSGKMEVGVVNVLVAIFREQQSHAVDMLRRQHVKRADVVKYIGGDQTDVGFEKEDVGDDQTDVGFEKEDAGDGKTDVGVEKRDAGDDKKESVGQFKRGISAVTGGPLWTARLLGPALVAIALTGWINQDLLAVPARPPITAYVYLVGALTFLAGLAIIRAHNTWSRRWPVLITLVGWFALIAGVGCMLAPVASLHVGQNVPVFSGLVLALLGIGIFLTTKAYKKSAG